MIKNLITQLNPGGFIKIGRKGATITSQGGKKFRPPKKLDHFQLVTTEKNEDGDYIVDVDLQNKIKKSKSGLQDKNGCLVGLPIRLLYNDTELNFPNRYISYVSGKLSCSGDGEFSTKRIDNFEKKHPCPCNRIKSTYQGNDKCKPTGALTCIIDEAGLFGQAHKFRTTSLNSIQGILGGIELIKSATGGKIAGLPLMLTMNAKQTTTPQGINTTIYIVSICYRGNLADLRQEVLQLISTEKQYLIEMDNIEKKAKANIKPITDEEETEILEEFFPDAVVSEENDQADKDTEYITTIDETDTIDQSDILDTKKESATINEISGILEPIDEYKKLYDKFISEKDFDKAYSFAKRLQRGHLIFWIVYNYPDVDIEPKIKKPELLLTVENILTTMLSPEGLELSQQQEKNKPSLETENEENKKTLCENSKEVFIRDHDDSGKITKDQLRKLVKLKITLEDQGTLRPEKWEKHVNYFFDADKNEISRAINLTTIQGDTFIKMLEKNVVEE